MGQYWVQYDDMQKKRAQKLSGQIRQAIDDSGQTRYRIARESGVDESALAKFYNGHRAITTATLDRLGEYLGLEIIVRKKGK